MLHATPQEEEVVICVTAKEDVLPVKGQKKEIMLLLTAIKDTLLAAAWEGGDALPALPQGGVEEEAGRGLLDGLLPAAVGFIYEGSGGRERGQGREERGGGYTGMYIKATARPVTCQPNLRPLRQSHPPLDPISVSTVSSPAQLSAFFLLRRCHTPPCSHRPQLHALL